MCRYLRNREEVKGMYCFCSKRISVDEDNGGYGYSVCSEACLQKARESYRSLFMKATELMKRDGDSCTAYLDYLIEAQRLLLE